MDADIAALLDEAEDIVNAAGIDLLAEQAKRKPSARACSASARSADRGADAVRIGCRGGRISRAVRRAMPVERRAVVAILVAVVLWSGTSLFVRAGHSDALVFTTWRLWFALPPLARDRRVAGAAHRQRAVLAGGRSAAALARAARRRGCVLRRRRGDHLRRARPDPAARRHADRLAATGPDHRVRGRVPRRARGAHAPDPRRGRDRGDDPRRAGRVGQRFVEPRAATSSRSLSLVFNAGWFLYGRVLRTSFVVDPFAFMLGTLTAAAVLAHAAHARRARHARASAAGASSSRRAR